MRPIRERLSKLQNDYAPSLLFRAAYVLAKITFSLAVAGLAGVVVKIVMNFSR